MIQDSIYAKSAAFLFLTAILGGCAKNSTEPLADRINSQASSTDTSTTVDIPDTTLEMDKKAVCKSRHTQQAPAQIEIRSDDQFLLSYSAGPTGDIIRINEDANLTKKERLLKAIYELKRIKNPGYDTLNNPLYFQWDTTLFKNDTQPSPRRRKVRPGWLLPYG